MPRALDFLTNFNDDVFQVEIRASYYFSFVTVTLLATGLAFQMPIFILALVRLRVLTAEQAAPEPPDRDRSGCSSSQSCSRPSTRCRSRSRSCRCSSSSSSRSGSRPYMEKRWDIAEQTLALERGVRVLSADWVLPVEGEPIEHGAVAIEDGRIAAVGTVDELGEGERFAEAAIVPGFVNAHTHLEYAVYAGFGDGLSFGAVDRDCTSSGRRGSTGADMEAIARLGAAECLALRDHDGRRPRVLGRERARLRRARAARDRLPRGLRQRRRRGDAASSTRSAAYVGAALSDRVRIGVSPHAPYTCSNEVYAACLALERAARDALNESQDELDWLLRGEGPWQPVAHAAVAAGRRRAASAASRPQGCWTRRVVAAHCVKVDEEEIGLLAAHDVAVAHCPRSNALLGCGIAPLAALRAAGLRVGVGTDGVSSVPSHDYFEELRTVIAARPSPRRARRRALRHRSARARDARRCARARARRPRSARSSPASAPISRSSPSPARRIYHGRIRRPPSCTAAARSASWLPSSTARHGTREEDSNGTS